MLRIGVFSKLSNVSIRMLRHYDEIGLLVPCQIDEISGYRYYSAAQLETISKIQRLKDLGFSLAVIKEMVYQQDIQGVEHFFEVRRLEIEEELERIKKQSMLLDEVKDIMKKDNAMNYHVIHKILPDIKVISVRKKVPSFYNEQDLWNELYSQISKQNVKLKTPIHAMAMYHDKEYKDRDVDLEVAMQVESMMDPIDDVKVYQTGEIEVASITFHGSYEQMPLVTQAVGNWTEMNGYELDGKMINIFHVSPAQEKNEENWITEACFLIERRGR
ncbi:DNA-binding transcriptional MerR regulator [Breznakia sp. PF5-3]|uniref:MerR family transcriptional regulator n=1 Tax=unclassified Breznakia TaxID=2623764 RepID=UPI0024050820|nr:MULTISPECIES: MerR family transcriptional regulator [unclassified Breznakia]MDF9824644.1 DNA-binding transcriptional MerR regulator [Breznakia sp. PM6-1]MDF9835629.1 DNA-binding transcriptional MerR regulator [Breznakia sp. PF5-3]MDF9837706.1 DNA-binding transcriptional MerR regulator [Breznakia sp. PFB2-8]MDF9859570.1 DNA-binding transcriptional MerR regulator [Breznakia sp. PH5-24]